MAMTKSKVPIQRERASESEKQSKATLENFCCIEMTETKEQKQAKESKLQIIYLQGENGVFESRHDALAV